jgi:protocatechuate 4,5-dioxygenase beta chain
VTIENLLEPGNATQGFMDFMLMMGVAGEGVTADYFDNLDLFHTMEAYFTWYPGGDPRKAAAAAAASLPEQAAPAAAQEV